MSPPKRCHPVPFLHVRPHLSTILCKFANKKSSFQVSPPGGCHPGWSAPSHRLVTPRINHEEEEQEVTLQLDLSKCVSVLLHGLESCPLNASDMIVRLRIISNCLKPLILRLWSIVRLYLDLNYRVLVLSGVRKRFQRRRARLITPFVDTDRACRADEQFSVSILLVSILLCYVRIFYCLLSGLWWIRIIQSYSKRQKYTFCLNTTLSFPQWLFVTTKYLKRPQNRHTTLCLGNKWTPK